MSESDKEDEIQDDFHSAITAFVSIGPDVRNGSVADVRDTSLVFLPRQHAKLASAIGQEQTSTHTPIVECLPMTDASLFMEQFVAHRVSNLPAEALAEVFDRLIWCFADNGHAICAVRGEWLQSADEYKVDITLCMNEVFPFPTRVQMEEHLHRIALQFPKLREKCATWLERAEALP